MAHTCTRILVHMVFATKDRRPLIVAPIKPKLHAYMAGICRHLNCHLYALDGVEDHSHLVFDLSPTVSLADFANRLKAGATKWARREGGLLDFGWQRGYGAFSLGQQNLNSAIRYVQSQENHHRRRSLADELGSFMRLHGMSLDSEFAEGVYRTPNTGA